MLHLHRADRADRLIGALAAVLAVPAEDPFAPEVVAVPTRGVERWLTQRLSAHLGVSGAAGRADGVCANVVFPTPRRLVDEVVAAASGFDPDVDPWLPQRLVWPLLETVGEHLAEPWLERLAAHLDGARGDRSRRLRTVQHLATLFDRYALYRPQLLDAWRDGIDDDGADPAGTLAEHDRWQAELWRRLRARVGEPGPAERQGAACERLLADPELSTLPARVALFGLTSLPARHLEVLRALADARDVHLLLLQPSGASWRALAREVERQGPARTRASLPTTFLPDNPLLASWGRDARELQMALATAGDAASDTHHDGDATDTTTLLARLQADVRADRMPERLGDDGAATPDPSLQIHACHGAGRQVEVLHDAILHALQDDPALEPRDVIVMCPDIETFAPLIQATFGAGASEEDDDEPRRLRLRVRLADRALRETNPVLAVVARLLELTTARATASEVLDLADREPVRRRFRIGQDDMSRLEEWVAATGTRWGFDVRHRERFGLQDVAQGTWDAGLDRLLTGVAMDEARPRLVAGVLPLDDVDSAAIDLAGRFAEYVDRLCHALDTFATPQPVDAWAAAIDDAADALTASAPRDAWQRSELQWLLAEVVDEAAGAPALLDAADVAALLETRLAGRPTRANFRTGHLTVCTLQPMRSVPHRVICLLGLDDTVFPRRSPRDGDDLLLAAPHVGDRDARSEDRQILLDALMAATDRVIITYTGNDERTNAPRAPAVPVAELLDVVGRMTDDEVVVRHPLQPFDPINFEPGALVPRAAWSFDDNTLAGARALVGERDAPAAFLDGPLPAAPRAPVLELDDVIAFLGHPVRAFLRQRLGIGAGTRAEEIDDALPIELDFLAQWGVGHRLLTARLGGTDPAAARAAERARGTLPPGAIGERRLADLEGWVDGVLAAAGGVLDLGAERRSLDVRLRVGPDGDRLLGGTVGGVAGDVLAVVTFARVSPQQRLAAWARMLALTAAFPDRPFSAVTVGRARRGAPKTRRVTVASIPPLLPAAPPEERAVRAHEQLEVLVDLYDRGMREPLPLYRETSAVYASGGRAAETLARKAWTSSFGQPAHEDRDDEHVLVLGSIAPFDDVLAPAPREDEAGDGWTDDPTRLGRYAHRLWDGLLTVEEVRDQ